MSDDDDVEYDDTLCTVCGSETFRRRCSYGCDDGYINRFEEDPMWYDVDDCSPCPECDGYGGFWWCPKCGHDMRKRAPEEVKP